MARVLQGCLKAQAVVQVIWSVLFPYIQLIISTYAWFCSLLPPRNGAKKGKKYLGTVSCKDHWPSF